MVSNFRWLLNNIYLFSTLFIQQFSIIFYSMRNLKKALRALCFALLIILALCGVGLSGGVAIPVLRKREDKSVTTELVEREAEEPEIKQEIL